MKAIRFLSGVLLPALAAACCLTACDFFAFSNGSGTIRVGFPQYLSSTSTRATKALPDTNDFILSVMDGKGNVIYQGAYGSAPAEFSVQPGSYTLSVVSETFDEPRFDAPQYGDTQVAVVSAGKTSCIQFNCYQLNSGIRLDFDGSFIDEYPSSTLYLKSLQGKLAYGYNETRIAYFPPGSVSLVLQSGAEEQTLLSRILESQQILTIHLSASTSPSVSSSGARTSIRIDTTRIWISEQFRMGDDGKGASPATAYSVSEAREHAGETDVWVSGYIVGGDLSSSNCRFAPPFSSRTNIAIAAKSSCRDKGACLSVQLAKGDIRDALNLVDHEGLLGRQVCLRGDLVEAYYGIPGLQNIKEYRFK